MHFAISLARCLTLHDSAPRYRRFSVRVRSPAGHRYNNPRMLIRLAAEHCRSTLSRARKWDPCPLSGLWLHLEDLINPVFHHREKIPMMDTWKMLTSLHHSCVGGEMLFNRLKYSESDWMGTRVSIFLAAAFDALIGIREGVLDPRFLPQSSRERKHNYFIRLYPEQRHRSVFKKLMERMKILQAVQVLAPRFRLYGTSIPNIVNAGGSALCIHKDLLT